VAGLPRPTYTPTWNVADRRLAQLDIAPFYGSANPLASIDLQDVQVLSNF